MTGSVTGRRLVLAALAVIAAGCTPYGARIRAQHAREFGCEERWVRVSEVQPRRWEATGCGFRSDWVCAEQLCEMRDHRGYGVDSP